MQNNRLKIYCDGGARGNPGPAASAFVVLDSQDNILKKSGRAIGHATNNIAEYQAALFAWEYVNTEGKHALTVDFYLDSLLVVNQLKGLFKIKNVELGKIATKIREEEKKFKGKASYSHIPRAKNEIADYLVNVTLDNLPQVIK